MKTFKEYISEESEKIFWHGSMSDAVSLRHGMHIGTKEQALKRFSDVTEYKDKNVNLHMYKITEKNARKPEEHIEIEDTGSPTLGQALAVAAKQGKIPENIARIARKKSDSEKARVLMKRGIHRVTYGNKFEDEGVSHIIVNPDDFKIEKV